jgi:hypothetical protein
MKKIDVVIGADLVMAESHRRANDCLHLSGEPTNCVVQRISSDVMTVKV